MGGGIPLPKPGGGIPFPGIMGGKPFPLPSMGNGMGGIIPGMGIGIIPGMGIGISSRSESELSLASFFHHWIHVFASFCPFSSPSFVFLRHLSSFSFFLHLLLLLSPELPAST